MVRLQSILVLAVSVGVIYLVTGRNRRQRNKIPEGMSILCQPPGVRYVIYALGVLMVALVGIFSAFYIMDGAPEEARSAWYLCVAGAILFLIIAIVTGNIMARECTYFNENAIQIERAFQKPRTVRWYEILEIDGNFDNMVNLYYMDGTKILTASIGMVNYKLFCDVLRKKCPEAVAVYYHSKDKDNPRKSVLRYGTEYYIVAGLGILIMLQYLAVLLFIGDDELLQIFSQSEPSKWFSLLFAPVCGVASMVFLFIMCNTKIRYSGGKMIIKYPLRKEKILYWRNIRRIEVIRARKRDQKNWKKLRLYTEEGNYTINFAYLTHGKDDFMEEVLEMVQKYEIPRGGEQGVEK